MSSKKSNVTAGTEVVYVPLEHDDYAEQDRHAVVSCVLDDEGMVNLAVLHPAGNWLAEHRVPHSPDNHRGTWHER